MPQHWRNSEEPIRQRIAALRGMVKLKPPDKSFDMWWAEYKAAEKALEEARFRRLFRH